ncbi:MAG TPA: HD domain-containing phosphohydrolase [Labilithrix sp.]
MTTRRVLLLDDEPLILRALKRAFAAKGLDVVTTTDPNEALARLDDAFDAVVSDLHMPNEDGARFLAEAARRTPATVRVLLSADPDFRPRVGNLADACVHALVGKTEMPRLPTLVAAQLEARHASPAGEDGLVDLAKRFGSAMARPLHEDDAHRDRLAALADAFAVRLGLSSEERLDARLAAILHDVGQITVPERVFTSTAPLEDADRVEVERHPGAGARLIGELPSLVRAGAIVHAHHASGGHAYPNDGVAVPIAARVLHLVDAYDAMRAGRPWSPARSHDEAIAELEQNNDAALVRTLADTTAH